MPPTAPAAQLRGGRGVVGAPLARALERRRRGSTMRAPFRPSPDSNRTTGPPEVAGRAHGNGLMASNRKLETWVQEIAAMCQPERVVWCDGSPAEYQEMLRLMVQGGTAQWLD